VKLFSRLILAYFAVIAVFVSVALLVFLLYTTRPAYRMARQEVQQWLHSILDRTRAAYNHGGADETERVLTSLQAPPETDLTLFDSLGHPRIIWGSAVEPSAEQLEAAFAGQQQLSLPNWSSPQYKGILCVPLPEGSSNPKLVVAISLPARLPPAIRSQISEGMLLALGLGVLASLPLAAWLSYRISRPVEQLTSASKLLGSGDLSSRVDASSPGELHDLAEQFNRMAAELQSSLQRVQAEKDKLADVERVQREFLADVSHNLRTPLTAVLGWTEALQDGIVESEEPIYLEKIHSQTVNLAHKVDRLLALSRSQQGIALLQKQTVAISEPIVSAVEAVAPAAEQQGSQLALLGELKYECSIDPSRMRDVFQILLENSVQHAGGRLADKANLRIEVAISVVDKWLQIEIRDNGCRAQTQPLQQEQNQAGHYPQRSTPNGLGLSIARRIVEAHNGEFHWQSGDEGTVALIRLPAV
jgi:signal transduction histidine kinase